MIEGGLLLALVSTLLAFLNPAHRVIAHRRSSVVEAIGDALQLTFGGAIGAEEPDTDLIELLDRA